MAGTVATTLRDGEDEHDIVVEVMPEYRDSLQAVMALNTQEDLEQRLDALEQRLASDSIRR